MDKLTIIQDSREKVPFNFDGDDDIEAVIVKKLQQGDYAIAGHEDLCVVERKMSADELYMNFGTKKNKDRFYSEAKRLKDKVKFRFIVIEATLDDILNPSSYYVNISRRNKYAPMMPAVVVWNNLFKFMTEFGIQVIFAGKKGQYITKKILLAIYKEHCNDKNR